MRQLKLFTEVPLEKLHKGLLALDRKQCRQITGLLTGHYTWICMLWASLIMLFAGNVDRRRNPPTTIVINAQLWLGTE
jgi:hypothetical protein